MCLLQCASLYPSPPHIMNLRAITTLQDAFGVPVGLSDHTLGIHVATAAVALGAQLLEKQQPDNVVSNMTKALRPGKVFVDWSQNSRHKTTIAPYSLRAKARPTVSTPVTWDEVSDTADGAPLSFESHEVLERVEQMGDLFAETATLEQELPNPR